MCYFVTVKMVMEIELQYIDLYKDEEYILLRCHRSYIHTYISYRNSNVF